MAQTSKMPHPDTARRPTPRREAALTDDALGAPSQIFECNVPARLDRLPWSRFHWLVVTALGVTWILDGLGVTPRGSLSGPLPESPPPPLSRHDTGCSPHPHSARA